MLLSLLLLQSAEGVLEEGEVFRWDGMTDCLQSEGWELAAPTIGPNGEVYGPPTAMVDSVEDGATPFCRFNGEDQYLAIKSTTQDPANPAEQTSVTHRKFLTIAVWFRSSYITKDPGALFAQRVGGTRRGNLGRALLLLTDAVPRFSRSRLPPPPVSPPPPRPHNTCYSQSTAMGTTTGPFLTATVLKSTSLVLFSSARCAPRTG